LSEPAEPTEEQLLDAVRQMKVADLLLSTAATLAQLGFAKLDESTRDLDQAKLAIEGMTALLGALSVRVEHEPHGGRARGVADVVGKAADPGRASPAHPTTATRHCGLGPPR